MATVPPLGTAANFAVLAGSTVTNTGATALVGDLGVSPGTAITGFPPGTVTGGTIHAGDAVAAQAEVDLTTAYNILAGQAVDQNLTGQDLGGLTLTPGVYHFSSSAQLTGTTHSRRPGRPQCGLRLPDRQHADDGHQLVRPPDQWRRRLQRILAGRKLRDARNRHRVRRKHSRAHEHHPEHRRQHRLR